MRQAYVDNLVAEFASDCVVIRHGSARLVDIAEAKLRGITPDPDEMHAIMAGVYGAPNGDKVDQLVLACTHFPLLSDEIAAASCAGVTLVDSGAGIARRTAFLIQGQDWPEAAEGRTVFTRGGDDVEALKPALATYGLTHTDTL